MHHISAIGRERGAQDDYCASRPRFQGEYLELNRAPVDAIKTIADAKGVTVAQIATAWVLSRGDDMLPHVGACCADRRAEPLGALTVTLSTDDLAALERAVPKGTAARARYAEAQIAHLDSGGGKSQACNGKHRCAPIDLLTLLRQPFGASHFEDRAGA